MSLSLSGVPSMEERYETMTAMKKEFFLGISLILTLIQAILRGFQPSTHPLWVQARLVSEMEGLPTSREREGQRSTQARRPPNSADRKLPNHPDTVQKHNERTPARVTPVRCSCGRRSSGLPYEAVSSKGDVVKPGSLAPDCIIAIVLE